MKIGSNVTLTSLFIGVPDDCKGLLPSVCGHVAAVIHSYGVCVYDEVGNVIETHEHKGDFKEP